MYSAQPPIPIHHLFHKQRTLYQMMHSVLIYEIKTTTYQVTLRKTV